MKKLRMIVTSVIVLAIVGSAFAFNAKKVAVFCTSTQNNSTCDATIGSRFIVGTGGTVVNYYQSWSGKASECTATGNTNCAPTIRLSNPD
jgi:hypothetical protein